MNLPIPGKPAPGAPKQKTRLPLSRLLLALFLASSLLPACQPAPAVSIPSAASPAEISTAPLPGPSPTLDAGAAAAPVSPTPPAGTCLPASLGSSPPYKDRRVCLDERVEDLLGRMTLHEKVGQMTQVEKNSIHMSDIGALGIGSILSGGGGYPDHNTPADWARMTDGFQEAALSSRLGVPLLYGVDAVHGHNNVYGAVVFPHNIGLGAANNPALMETIGRITALEMVATGAHWNFAPAVSIPQDIRWGRTYEGYGEKTALVTRLAVPYLRGLQTLGPGQGFGAPGTVLATPKHFVGDGGTRFGSSAVGLLDQGETRGSEEVLRAVHLPPYIDAIQAGALCIMVSFSSWQDTKMHANHYLLTEVLKGELGFEGFLVSDWKAIDQVSSSYYQAVVISINAGVDMNMVPYDYRRFIDTLVHAVEKGEVRMERIDDAVRRILRVKFAMGLFERPFSDPSLLPLVGSQEHRAAARQAVRESLVLLKNEQQTLPLKVDTPLIYVGGQAANDIGLQSGGWTIEWAGRPGPITPGVTLLEGIQSLASGEVVYDPAGQFEYRRDASGKRIIAGTGIAVVGETPYAEFTGDTHHPALSEADIRLIERMRAASQRLVVVVLSGRPVELTGQLPLMDALVAAWLPGTEGDGVAEVLFGEYDFRGRLPYTWPRWTTQLPFSFSSLPEGGCDAPLFLTGYGLTYAQPQPFETYTCTRPNR